MRQHWQCGVLGVPEVAAVAAVGAWLRVCYFAAGASWQGEEAQGARKQVAALSEQEAATLAAERRRRRRVLGGTATELII